MVAQVPGARLETKIGIGQSPYRADINNVSGIPRIIRLVIESIDLVMKSTVQHYQTTPLLDAFAVSRATLAGNTTFSINCDDRAERCRLDIVGAVKLHTCIRRPELKRIILKRAFTTFITYRAIERMIEKREFENPLLRFFNLFCCRLNHHIGSHIHRACRHQLRHFFYLNQTHAATTQRTDFFVIAEDGNIYINLFGCVCHLRSFRNRDRFSVDC